MTGTRSRHKEAIVFCLVLLAAAALFWWRVWIPNAGDRMHFTDDIFIKDYATRIGMFSTALSGYMPLWDPYQFGGWPGIANCEAGFFYPPNWVIVPFLNQPQTAFFVTELLVLLHMVIAGLGAFQLARSIGLSIPSSAFAGFAFTFCGFHCAHKKHTNMLFALVWFPWILLCIENWLRERKEKFLIIATVLLALAFVAGHPQSALYMSLILFARLLYAGISNKDNVSWLCSFSFAGLGGMIIALAFGLTAVQWLPTAELIEQSARAEADQYQRSTEFSLPPLELVDAILPEAVSPWHQTEVFYWGIVPLILTLLCLRFSISNALLKFLLVVGVASVFFALGEYFFVYDLTYLLIPGTAWVRAPSRWIYFASLPVALTAAYVLDRFNTSDIHPPVWLRSWIKPVWLVWGVLLLGVLLWILLNPGTANEPNSVQRLTQSKLILLVIFFGLFAAAIHAYSNHRIRHRTLVYGMLLITWADLATHYHQLDLAPGEGGHAELTETEKHLLQDDEHRTKVFLYEGGNRTRYHGAAQLFRELDGQSPLTPRIHLEIREDTAVKNPKIPNETLLKLFHADSLLHDQSGFPPSFQNVEDLLFAFQNPYPRAMVLPEEFHVETAYQRRLMRLQSFPYSKVSVMDQSKSAIAETFKPSPATPFLSKPFLLASASSDAVQSSARLIIDGVNHFEETTHDTGYAVAVIDPQTARVESVNSFNLPSTEPNPDLPKEQEYAEQKRMLAFMESVQPGKTVMAVVHDNGANNLGVQGVLALRQIGVMSDLRKAPLRLAHLIIGKKGAPVGSAIEITSSTEAMVLQTGHSFYYSGLITGKPKRRLYATINNAPEIYDLYNKTFPQNYEGFLIQNSSDIQNGEFPVPILVYSAPKKTPPITPDQASIQIRGKEYSLNQTGYNIVVADGNTLEVKDQKIFNLLLDLQNVVERPVNKEFQNYLRSVEEGDYIFGAIRDEAIDLMTTETRDLLRSFGSTLNAPIESNNPDNRKRFSHAFMMIKGTSTCIEAYGQDTDAVLYTRYSGGPRLMDTDLKYTNQLSQSFDTYQELITEASGTLNISQPPAGTEWLVEENGPGELLITGRSSGGILFVSEVFYPGWKVFVDGIEAPLHRINYFFRGVELEPGYHEIRMVYTPESFYSGAMISLFSLLLLSFWIIRVRFNLITHVTHSTR